MDRIYRSTSSPDIIRRLCNMVHQKANMISGIRWTSLDGEMGQLKIYNSQLFIRNKIEIPIMPTTSGTLWINVFLQGTVSEGQPKKLGHTSERLQQLITPKFVLLGTF